MDQIGKPLHLAVVGPDRADGTGSAEYQTLAWEAEGLGWEVEYFSTADAQSARWNRAVTAADAIVMTGTPRVEDDQQLGEVLPGDRSDVDVALVRHAALAATPLLGIGRGHQSVNLAFGGTMTDALTPAGRAVHGETSGPERVELRVSMARTSALAFRLGESLAVVVERGPVVDSVGQGLRAAAWTPEGYVAALEHEVLPITSVHWLPAAEQSEAGQTLLLLDGLAREAARSTED